VSFSIDDGWDNCGPVARAGNTAFGVYCRCGAWVARNIVNGQITDPVVPREVAAVYGSPELASKLESVGLWVAVDGGWLMPHYLERNPSAEMIRFRKAQQAKRNALGRDPALRHAIRLRDGDRCRYCGVEVRWTDRKGPQGATYDHVDTNGPNTYENLVIACRSCNCVKGDRPLGQTGLVLLPPPDNLGATQIGSKSESKSNLGVTSHLTSPLKGGKTRTRATSTHPPPQKPHAFDDDGSGTCTCSLPRINKIHRAA
jgi:5-methylcytosine-specific restriction endonuclease McrA